MTLKEASWTIPLVLLLLLISPLILVVLVFWLFFFVVYATCLRVVIWTCWCPRGLDILFVYSDSPIWHDYIERQILPLLGERAVVLNWSDRNRWRFSLARMAFYHFGGYREFNPLGVVFRPFRRTREFRFWQAFRDYKHGHPEELQRVEREFLDYIGVTESETIA